MISMLKNWKGAISIDGTEYNSISELSNFDFKTLNESTVIKLSSSNRKSLESSCTQSSDSVKSDYISRNKATEASDENSRRTRRVQGLFN